MGHNRRLVLGGSSLTITRSNRHAIAAGSEVRDELEPVLISSGYFDTAPFKWVGLILRFGLKNDSTPAYNPIDGSDGELPIAIELDSRDLQNASRDELKRLFTVATLKALIDVAKKYDLPFTTLTEMLTKLSVTPKGTSDTKSADD